MTSLIEGTLNVQIPESYFVIPTRSILPHEYPLNIATGLNETIKLQRCIIGGHKAIIMRPDAHERGMFHGPIQLELIGAVKFRQVLGLEDESAVDVEVEGDDCWWAAAI
jgi:CTP-dependent riboflavin kinase